MTIIRDEVDLIIGREILCGLLYHNSSVDLLSHKVCSPMLYIYSLVEQTDLSHHSNSNFIHSSFGPPQVERSACVKAKAASLDNTILSEIASHV